VVVATTVCVTAAVLIFVVMVVVVGTLWVTVMNWVSVIVEARLFGIVVVPPSTVTVDIPPTTVVSAQSHVKTDAARVATGKQVPIVLPSPCPFWY
jgi:hypothetical protein